MKERRFTQQEIDMYKEIGSIGSGNAATALSQMVNRRVTINPIQTKVVPLEEVPDEIGGAEMMVMAIYQHIMGDLGGDAVYLHSKENAMELIRFLTGKSEEETGDEPTEEEISTYKEMANIFTGSYLTAISSLLDIMIVPSVPHYAGDMLGALIDQILAQLGQKIEAVLLIKSELNIDYKQIGGGYLMIFNPESMERMVNIINDKYDINDSGQ